jgi:hypothetical protein
MYLRKARRFLGPFSPSHYELWAFAFHSSIVNGTVVRLAFFLELVCLELCHIIVHPTHYDHLRDPAPLRHISMHACKSVHSLHSIRWNHRHRSQSTKTKMMEDDRRPTHDPHDMATIHIMHQCCPRSTIDCNARRVSQRMQ